MHVPAGRDTSSVKVRPAELLRPPSKKSRRFGQVASGRPGGEGGSMVRAQGSNAITRATGRRWWMISPLVLLGFAALSRLSVPARPDHGVYQAPRRMVAAGVITAGSRLQQALNQARPGDT